MPARSTNSPSFSFRFTFNFVFSDMPEDGGAIDRVVGLCYNSGTFKAEEVGLMYESTQRGLKVWFRDEIQNALTAVDTANMDLASSIDSPEIQIYRKGYAAAIRAVAAAFGVPYSPQTLSTTEPEVVDSPGWVRVFS
jgi:hypothetical protein